MRLQRNKCPSAQASRAIIVPELSDDELALLRWLFNLSRAIDWGCPEACGETVARWESAAGMRPLYASFRELDRLTRLFEYLTISLRQYPEKLRLATELRDSLHRELMGLGNVIDCRPTNNPNGKTET